ncbi:Ni/Fe hydrogenase [Seongchinamella sediminis]|uniref:Ni/Fe hydrogenase n=1 Tax=Seongchinamella sediminis TaxID=2283635 RepID=A0A3L7E2R5_9GAMM|nr:HupE/UreJ family protein [Seongchinamella sediminis]RLQ23070.1 Ni/Fe hydrogenase [Seongchinamella sediminis]
MRLMVLATGLLFISQTAFAHEASGLAGGFASGLMHPVLGWDHVAAMVAVGLWGAVLGQPAIWVLPVTFPLVMAIGGALGVAGVALPGVEIGIAASALVLGVMVLAAARPPLWLAALIVAAFAVFHGHAHGTELPGAASPLAYSLGFVLSTGLLHMLGIAFGLLTRWRSGVVLVRAGGAVIAMAGALFLSRAI